MSEQTNLGRLPTSYFFSKLEEREKPIFADLSLFLLSLERN